MSAGITTLRSRGNTHMETTAIDLTDAEVKGIADVITCEFILVRHDLGTPSRTERSRFLLITRPIDKDLALEAIDAHLATFD